MIKVTTYPNNVIKLETQPDLVMYEDLASIDDLIRELLSQKPAITELESLAALNS